MTPLQAVFFCDWHAENPYLQQLRQGLETHCTNVILHSRSLLWAHKILLTEETVSVVHFQTLHRFFVSRNQLYYWLKFLLFVGQIFLLRQLGIAVVLTVHEWKDKLADGQFDISNRKACILGKVFSAVITHCDSAKIQFIESTQLNREAANKVFVVPHGSYIDSYKNDVSLEVARAQLNLPKDAFVFLIFGGIHPAKGVIEVIETFIEMEIENGYLVIAGKASAAMSQEIFTRIETAPEGKILVNPDYRIPDDEVQLYMKSCDVVLLPYKIFTTSGVALLAMSFARPCVAPNVGFFKDVFGEEGAILYNSQDEEGLSSAMRSAIETDRLTEMGTSNLFKAAHWNWNYVARETRRVYDLALN